MQDFNKVLFKKFDNLNLGFFKGKIIIRLDIQNKNLNESFMFVNNDMINRNYSFYKLDKRTNSLQLLNKTIDTTIQDHRTFNFPNPNFKIDLAPNEKATYFIETISDGRTVDATPQLMSMTSYSSFINENTIWSILFLGIVACLLLINIYQWTIYREKIYPVSYTHLTLPTNREV